jgi:hypothetical protein
VTGTGSPAQTVTWTLSGTDNPGTTISANGTLTVAANEIAASLTVTASSTVDDSKSGTAAVTVTGPSVVMGFQIHFTGPSGDVNVSGDFKLSISDTTYSSITISVENDEDYDSFRWLVDGEDLSGETGGSITLNASTYTAGAYWLTVIAKKDRVPYSREFSFAVID